MPKPASLLRIEALSKRFGTLTVLSDVSLEVARGEVVAIIGPSGSGKSTLLRCINRLEMPDAGSVHLDGVPVAGRGRALNALRREIGFVFQSFNLYPHLRARDNVGLALRWVLALDRREARRRAEAALVGVGLADKLDAFPHQLSGGQQQRVAIARALALDPKVLLLDEPTSALDPELVGEILTTIAALRQRGMTMLLVTHELAFAREVADRVVMMADGAVIEQGPPASLLTAPEHPRTRQFLERLLRVP